MEPDARLVRSFGGVGATWDQLARTILQTDRFAKTKALLRHVRCSSLPENLHVRLNFATTKRLPI